MSYFNRRFVMLNGSAVELTSKDSLELLWERAAAQANDKNEEAFYIVDVDDIIQKYQTWQEELPRVEPHYAVKCNDSKVVLSALNKLGVGFDCASKAEIQQVLKLKVSADRIVFANPCKLSSHIKYAAKNNVVTSTFDNADELYKIKRMCPEAKLLLRLLPPIADKAQCGLGMKFGCHPKNAPQLLELAKELGLNVIGTSFHVGSGCWDANAFVTAVESSRAVFDVAEQIGFHFTVLDIGGGFPGNKTAELSFQEICAVLRPALDDCFPASSGVRLIAEPGRFFVSSAFTLLANVIAKRATARDREGALPTANDEPSFMYYLNDGVYGSFNCILYENAQVTPEVPPGFDGEMKYSSSVWGPTCDGLDCVMQSCMMPELEVGNWMMFRNMGAYTLSCASTFNGMPKPAVYYKMSKDSWEQLNFAESRKKLARIPRMCTGHSICEDHTANLLSMASANGTSILVAGTHCIQ